MPEVNNPRRVYVSAGVALNLGNYQSARLEFGWGEELPPAGTTDVPTHEELTQTLMDRLVPLLNEEAARLVRSVDNAPRGTNKT